MILVHRIFTYIYVHSKSQTNVKLKYIFQICVTVTFGITNQMTDQTVSDLSLCDGRPMFDLKYIGRPEP